MSKFFKNFILCGEVDFHCLLCNENFADNAELEKHIRWENHRKSMKNQTCVPKFKKDSIFKLEDYFYCEHCNFTVKGFANIKSHVTTDAHKSFKNDPESIPKRIEAKYIDTDSVLINKLILKKLQWHGILYKQCLICNVAVKNAVDHLRLQDHMINLIQAKVHCDNDKFYRNINDKTFQCFSCKNTFPLETLDEHWNTMHTETKQPEVGHEVNWENKIIVPVNDKVLMAEMENKEYKLKDLNVTDDHYFNIDIKKNKVTCKTCKKHVKLSTNDLHKHFFDHKEKDVKSNLLDAVYIENEKEYLFCPIVDHGRARSELANYGRQNYIKMNASGSKGYCTLCDKTLSANINIFKEHVEGKYHKGHLEMKGFIKPRKHVKGTYRTDNMGCFLKSIVYSPIMKAFWINLDFITDHHSFLLLKRIEHGQHFKKTKCFPCDVFMEWSEEREHCMTRKHKSNFMAARVLCYNHEFIREISPRYYHCGFCNVSLPFYETVPTHLDNLVHKMQRIEKDLAQGLSRFVETYGLRPTTKSIKRNVDNEELYQQFLNLVFGEK